MARGKIEVTENKLYTVLNNWAEKTPTELAQMLKVDEKTVNQWVVRLRKTMKSNGMADEQITKLLPRKRKAQSNVFETVVKELLTEKPKRKPKK